jgi:hypothetical protein
MHFDSISLGVRHLFQKLVLLFYVKLYLYIVVFRIKISIRITTKNMYVFLFEKKYFDSLALKPLELYVNLVGRFVAYSQSFNLVYR